MILEQYIFCPETLSKLRNGPLANLIDGFLIWLQNSGFTNDATRKHLLNISRFNDYLSRAAPQPLTVITSTDVDGFLKEPLLPCHHRKVSQGYRRQVGHSINRFVAYLTQQDCFISESKPKQPVYQPLLDDYLSWLRNYQHLALGSVELRRQSIIHFLHWLGPRATLQGLSELTSSQVEAFFLTHAKDMGRSARRSLQAALRTFFRFCSQQGTITLQLDKAVPTLRTYKLATVPRTISEAQAQVLLESIDRQTSVGKRNYAIVMLLYTFGVRCGQVAALRLEDIHWSEAQILFRATKHGKETLLPLTEEMGNCLFSYIKEARPDSVCPEVFLTARAPYRSLFDSRAISEIIRRYVVKMDFDLPTKGAHLFRHCFAGRMVQQGNSLKAVADMLGHCCLSTTFIYTKIDFNALQQVALPWPQEVSTC